MMSLAYPLSRRLAVRRKSLMLSCASFAIAAVAVAPQAAHAQAAPPAGAFRGTISSSVGSVARNPVTNTTETITIGVPSLQDRDANVERINDIMLGARIKCPCLVLIGEDDYAEVKELVSLYERCRARGVPIELKLFSGEETGAAHRQIDNPTLGRHFIFDWLKERLLIGESEGCLDPTFGLLKEVVADLQIVNPSRST